MKLIKLLMLFCVGAFFIASSASGQANAFINILTQNSGQVNLGGTVNIQVEVGNTGPNSILASKVKTAITVPIALVSLLPNAQQTGLPAGWTILSNNAATGVITLCNGTDVIANGDLRTILIKVQGNTLGGPSTIIGQLSFSGGTNCGSPGSLSGDNAADNNSTSSVEVIPAAACTLTASASAGTIACNGGTTTLTASSAGTAGAVEYSITGGAPFQSGNTFTVTAGTYTVTAREVSTPACTATATAVTITQPAILAASASSTAVSSAGATNGTATALVTGGTAPYGYSWAPGGQTTATATALAAGSYTVTVTDANGCITTATTTVGTLSCTLSATASAGTILCNGGTTTLTATAAGSIGAVQYSITGGAPFQSGNTFTVPAGTYTVTVREVGNNACTVNTAAVVIGHPSALVASSSASAILCNGGSSTVTVSATGGTAPYTGTGSFSRTAGAYSYTVTDANGCTSITSGTISQPTPIVVSATFAPIAVFGGTTTVNVTATGGTAPYTGTGAFVSADGTFTFTVTDANGCTGSTTVTIPPFATAVIADPAVGQMNFTTLANASQTASSLLFTQNYNIKIPFYNLNQTTAVPNGTIKVTVDLGTKLDLATGFNLATAPLSTYFAWTSNVVAGHVIITGTQIAIIPADFASTLVFQVKGILSCSSSIASNINVVNTLALLVDQDLQNNAATLQYSLPVTVTSTQVNVTCNGLANGQITPIASPGTTVVIRNSSNVVVGSTGLAPGVYTITATATGDAANSCSATASVTIVQPTVLSLASGTVVNNICNGGNIGSITVIPAGGTAPYTYTIAGPTVNTTGATSGIFTNLFAGTYIVTVTDANGCTSTRSETVSQPTGTAPDISLGSDFSGSIFTSPGVTQTIVYNVTEIAGNSAVGDTIRITKVAGFTINFNVALFNIVVGGSTYTLDNSRWKIDNSDPQFVSIILTDPLNAANPGTLLCNQLVRVAVSLTRNTTDVSTFTLSARLRKANGELNLNNNLNSIILNAD